MSLSTEQQQALDQMPAPDALLYLAGKHGGGKAGAIGEIAAVCDFGQAVGAVQKCGARLFGVCPALSGFPAEITNAAEIVSGVIAVSAAISDLSEAFPQD